MVAYFFYIGIARKVLVPSLFDFRHGKAAPTQNRRKETQRQQVAGTSAYHDIARENLSDGHAKLEAVSFGCRPGCYAFEKLAILFRYRSLDLAEVLYAITTTWSPATTITSTRV
jgi:hypothetical protein